MKTTLLIISLLIACVTRTAYADEENSTVISNIGSGNQQNGSTAAR
jgi:hypothetical protein